MFLAIADAGLKHEIGDLAVTFVAQQRQPARAPAAPTAPGGTAPAPPPPPLFDVVKAEVLCKARWANLFGFLDDLYGDGVVPFEMTRLVVGKTYESLQKEKDVVTQTTFDTKEKATKDPGVGPDPALDVLVIELVGYDWKGEPVPAAGPAGKQ